MSPQDRKKRRRLAVAAFAANGLGAVTGFAVHAVVPDPATSVMAGAIISGTVGDVLRQLAGTPNDDQQPDRWGELCPEEERQDDDVRLGGDDIEADDEAGGDAQDHRLEREQADEIGRTPHSSRTRHERLTTSGRGYARCAQHGGHVVPPQLPAGGVGMPMHPRHRHLQRSAQKFARRTRAKQTRQPGGGHATS